MSATEATTQILFRTTPNITAEVSVLIEAGTRQGDQ